jgi:exopolyphosphatase/guanosine-5'-triphosphate,3'-diphosphate pyrophosphatase
LAAVDVGSNTVHSLVADLEDGRLADVAHYVEMPQLSVEVARTGRIGPAKQEEAIAALRSVVDRAREHGCEGLVAGATAAVRNAADREEFLAAATAAIDTPVRLIGERREAELSFAGVASRHASDREWLMADIGGGSTEVVVGKGRTLERWISLPLGSGTLAEQYLADPPQPAERRALRQAALRVLAGAPESDAEKLVVTGGTASNLPLVLSSQHPPELLDTEALLEAERRLDGHRAARVAEQTGLPEARVRALRAGVEILLLLLDFYGLGHLHVSHEGIRHGMLLAFAERPERWWE